MTMVVTHVPSNVLIIILPLMPTQVTFNYLCLISPSRTQDSLPLLPITCDLHLFYYIYNQTLAFTVLFLRYSIGQMDVPTRNAYVQVSPVNTTISACVFIWLPVY